MTDAFLVAFTQLASDKAQIMDTTSTQLRNANNSTTVARTLRTAAEKLRHFYEVVERPFERQYSDCLESQTESMDAVMHKHRQCIEAFISALQRVKCDDAYAKDSEVTSAVVDFELATCHIPAPG